MAMKRMRFVMNRRQCLAWFSNMSWKVAIIVMIQDVVSSNTVASTFPIASAAMKFLPWRWGLFLCGKF